MRVILSIEVPRFNVALYETRSMIAQPIGEWAGRDRFGATQGGSLGKDKAMKNGRW